MLWISLETSKCKCFSGKGHTKTTTACCRRLPTPHPCHITIHLIQRILNHFIDPVKLFERKRLESSMNSKQRNVSSGERGSFSSLPGTIVRLVLTSQRNFHVNEQCLLLNEDILPGHVAVNSLIRRQLKLGVKSTVQIRKIHHKPSTLLGLVLNPFGNSAKKVKF